MFEMKSFLVLFFFVPFIFSNAFDENLVTLKNEYERNNTESGYETFLNVDPFVSDTAIYYIKTISNADCKEAEPKVPCLSLFFTKFSSMSQEHQSSLPSFFELCQFSSFQSKILISLKKERGGDCFLRLIDEDTGIVTSYDDFSVLNTYQLSWNEKTFLHVKNETFNGILAISDEKEEYLIEKEFKWIQFPSVRPNYVKSKFSVNDDSEFLVDKNTENLLFIGEETNESLPLSLYWIKTTEDGSMFKRLPLNESQIVHNPDFELSRDEFFIFLDDQATHVYVWNPEKEELGYIMSQGEMSWKSSSVVEVLFFLTSESIVFGDNSKVLYRCSESSKSCEKMEGSEYSSVIVNPRTKPYPEPIPDVEYEAAIAICEEEGGTCYLNLVGVNGISPTGELLERFSGFYDYSVIYNYLVDYFETLIKRPTYEESTDLLRKPDLYLRYILNLEAVPEVEGWVALIVESGQASHIKVFDWNSQGGCLPACNEDRSKACTDRVCDCKDNFGDYDADYLICAGCASDFYLEDCSVECTSQICHNHGNCDMNGTCICSNIHYKEKSKCKDCKVGWDIVEKCEKCSKEFKLVEVGKGKKKKETCKKWECGGVTYSNPNVCSGHGECSDIDKCECEQGFIGHDCEKENGNSDNDNDDDDDDDDDDDVSGGRSFLSWLTLFVLCFIVPFYIILAVTVSYCSVLRRKRHQQEIIARQEGHVGVAGIIPPLDEENLITGHFVELEEEEGDDQRTKSTVPLPHRSPRDVILNLDKKDEDKFTLGGDGKYDDDTFN